MLPPGVSEDRMDRELGPEDCEDHECRCFTNPPCSHCERDCPTVDAESREDREAKA